MGAIIAKLLRRRTSTRDVLSKIRDDIQNIEEFKQSTKAWQTKVIGYLLSYFSVIYLIAALVAYFKYFSSPYWRDFTSQLQLLTPFIVAPLIFYLIKRILTWWYHRKIRRNEVQLDKLKKEKAKILDEVMETETYKVAKELLDEFASDAEKKALNLIKSPQMNSTARSKSMLETSRITANSDLNQTHQQLTQQPLNTSEVRKRQINQGVPNSPARSASSSNVTVGQTSFMQHDKTPTTARRPAPSVPMSRGAAMNTPLMNRPPLGPPLPRPVLPRERGYMDRVVEYLVGDGPNNRYALICKQCQSHNGMALREEFEYIAFRCCYCHYWNPARKQRPTAPRLDALRPQISTESSSSSSDEEVPNPSSEVQEESAKDIRETEESSEAKAETKRDNTDDSESDDESRKAKETK